MDLAKLELDYIVFEGDNQIHLLPHMVDATKHELSQSCWCKPELEIGKNKQLIYTHGAIN